MTAKQQGEEIFLLSDDGISSVLETTTEEYAARLIEAIPDDWSALDGLLEAPEPDAGRGGGAPEPVRDTGYAFARFGADVRIVARLAGGRVTSGEVDDVARPDLVGLLLEGRPPGFVSFRDTGCEVPWLFPIVKRLAAAFVRRGYSGWLSFNNGRGEDHDAGHEPAEVEFQLSPWERFIDLSDPRRTTPPAVVLRWDERRGGSPAQLEPVRALCRLACRALPAEG